MPEQDVAAILKKVRRIQIVANRTVNDFFAGQYKSVFRGRGMEFDAVREYQPGDDVRTIDWNVTARTGTPFVKQFCEERELTILFAVDASASGAFGSGERSKLDMMVEVAAVMMFSALKNNDKVGLVTFCDTVLGYYPPRKGKSNVLHLIRELISIEPVARPTSLAAALEFLTRVQNRRAVVFLLSDFQAPETRHSLALCNSRHDVIAVSVTDPREQVLPDVGFISLVDAETGQVVEVDTRHPKVRELFAGLAAQRAEKLSDELRRVGVDELAIRTDKDYLESFRRFFHIRERRFR